MSDFIIFQPDISIIFTNISILLSIEPNIQSQQVSELHLLSCQAFCTIYLVSMFRTVVELGIFSFNLLLKFNRIYVFSICDLFIFLHFSSPYNSGVSPDYSPSSPQFRYCLHTDNSLNAKIVHKANN